MSYGREYTRLSQYNDTQIINGYEKYVFTYGEKAANVKKTVLPPSFSIQSLFTGLKPSPRISPASVVTTKAA